MDADQLRRLDSLLGDPNVPEEDKNRAVAMARAQESGGGLEAGLGYVKQKAGEIGSAGLRLGKTALYGPVDYPPSTSDVLTVGGPALQLAGGPISAAAVPLGVAAGAGLRAAGEPEDIADLANAGVQ